MFVLYMIKVDLVGGPETTRNIAAIISSLDLVFDDMAKQPIVVTNRQIIPNNTLSSIISTIRPSTIETMVQIMLIICT